MRVLQSDYYTQYEGKMVFTRQMLSSAQAASETEKESDWAELKTDRKTRVIAKEGRISKRTLRKNIKGKLVKNGFKRSKVIRFDNQQHLSVVVSQKLNCPICLEFIMEPILTPCGHAFCLACVEQSLKHKNACSLCRETVTLEQPMPSTLLKNLVGRVSERRFSREEMEEYEKRRESFQIKEAQRKLNSEIKIGDMVDFYMERGWHEGKVAQIREEANGKILKIKSCQNQNRIRQLGLNSRLLARYRAFTKQPTFTRRNSIFMFEFEDELFNSISNSVFFFLESPVRHIEFLEMEAN